MKNDQPNQSRFFTPSVNRIPIHADSTGSLEDHFHGRRAAMEPLFNLLIERLGGIDFQFKVGKSYVGLIRQLVFAALHIQTEKIIVEFVTRKKFESPRITKTNQFQKARWAQFVSISQPQDIDDELIHWIEEASQYRPLRRC